MEAQYSRAVRDKFNMQEQYFDLYFVRTRSNVGCRAIFFVFLHIVATFVGMEITTDFVAFLSRIRTVRNAISWLNRFSIDIYSGPSSTAFQKSMAV
jgi:hypothetical protein